MAVRTWALVIDPKRARVLRGFNGLDGEEPIEFISHASGAHLRAIVAPEDKPGVAQHSTAAQGSNGAAATAAIAAALRRDMVDFVEDILSFLELRHHAHHFDRLVILADPSILPTLQTHLSAVLRDGLITQSARQLMTLPEGALRQRVRAIIAQSQVTEG